MPRKLRFRKNNGRVFQDLPIRVNSSDFVKGSFEETKCPLEDFLLCNQNNVTPTQQGLDMSHVIFHLSRDNTIQSHRTCFVNQSEAANSIFQQKVENFKLKSIGNECPTNFEI